MLRRIVNQERKTEKNPTLKIIKEGGGRGEKKGGRRLDSSRRLTSCRPLPALTRSTTSSVTEN